MFWQDNHVGFFIDPLAAAMAYDKAVQKFNVNWATDPASKLNFPPAADVAYRFGPGLEVASLADLASASGVAADSPLPLDRVSLMSADGAPGSKRKGSAGRGGGAVPSEGECIVCWEDKACVALSPCGHVCLCETCAPQQRQCPVCRSDVSCTLRVYFSMACLQ
jgi:hypothetical protein